MREAPHQPSAEEDGSDNPQQGEPHKKSHPPRRVHLLTIDGAPMRFERFALKVSSRTLAHDTHDTVVSPETDHTLNDVFLETLQSWTERNRGDLESAGVTVTLSEPTKWDKPSQGVTLSTPSREGEVLVWISGECEVMVGDVASPEVDMTHHDLTVDTELLDVLDAFRDRFLASGG